MLLTSLLSPQEAGEGTVLDGKVQGSAGQQKHGDFADGYADSIKPEAAADDPGELPAYQNGIGQGGQQKANQGQLPQLRLPAQPHSGGSQGGGGRAHQKIHRQSAAGGQIKEHAAQCQTGDGSGGIESQNAQRLGQPKLDCHGGAFWKEHVLGVGQHDVQGGDESSLGKLSGMFHSVSPNKKWAQP